MAAAATLHRGLPQMVEAPWPLAEALPFPFLKQAAINGFDGWGFDAAEFAGLWPVPFFAVLWLAARVAMKRAVLPAAAVWCGVPARKRKAIEKFGYQGWLGAYYTTAVVLGYWFVMRHEPYANFPISLEDGVAMFTNHPVPMKATTRGYYCVQLGFYIAETYALVVETRRSDFWEYVAHHATTIFLVALSFAARQHRVGCYIFFLHDVTDIFMCAAKMMLYAGREALVNVLMATFTLSFVFLRLYCFPKLSWVIFTAVPQILPATVSYWVLAYALCGVLQALHLFWFYLLVRFLLRTAMGSAVEDPRSDEDEPEAAADKADKKLN